MPRKYQRTRTIATTHKVFLYCPHNLGQFNYRRAFEISAIKATLFFTNNTIPFTLFFLILLAQNQNPENVS